MNFISTFIQTITNATIYGDIATKKLSSSFGYFLACFSAFSLIASLILYTFFLPNFLTLVENNLAQLTSQFPSNGTVSIQDQRFVLENIPTPLTLSLNFPGSDQLNLDHILVIDPEASPRKIKDLKTLLLLTSSDLVVSNLYDPNLYTSLPVAEFPENATLSQTTLQNLQLGFTTIIKQLEPYFFWLIFFSLLFGLTLTRLVSALFFSLWSYVLGMFINRRYPYQTLLKISLHTIILAQILEAINILFLPGNFNIFPVALIGINTIALFSLPVTPKNSTR